jgi:hypothetical protein
MEKMTNSKNQGKSYKANAIVISFVFLGSILGLATLAINPYGTTLSIFVSVSLFIMALASIANYTIQANHIKILHRIVVTIETVAAVVVILEVLSYVMSETVQENLGSLIISRAFDLAVLLAFLLFELHLGYDILRYVQSKSKTTKEYRDKSSRTTSS